MSCVAKVRKKNAAAPPTRKNGTTFRNRFQPRRLTTFSISDAGVKTVFPSLFFFLCQWKKEQGILGHYSIFKTPAFQEEYDKSIIV